MSLYYYRTTILVTILQLIQQAIMFQYPYDTTTYYVTILLLIQQATMSPSYYWYKNPTLLYSNRYRNHYITTPLLMQHSITLLYFYWYSKLQLQFTYLIQQSNLLLYSATILCYYILLYYNGYSNLDDMIPLLQQPTIPLYMTWYNNL